MQTKLSLLVLKEHHKLELVSLIIILCVPWWG